MQVASRGPPEWIQLAKVRCRKHLQATAACICSRSSINHRSHNFTPKSTLVIYLCTGVIEVKMNFKHEICFPYHVDFIPEVGHCNTGLTCFGSHPHVDRGELQVSALRTFPLECCAFTTLSFLKEYLAHRKHVKPWRCKADFTAQETKKGHKNATFDAPRKKILKVLSHWFIMIYRFIMKSRLHPGETTLHYTTVMTAHLLSMEQHVSVYKSSQSF